MTSLDLFIGMVLGLVLGVILNGILIFTRKIPHNKTRFEFDVHTNSQITFIGVKGMILTNEEQVTLGIRAVTKGGKPARFEGTPVWESSDPGVAMVEVGTDPMTAVAKAVAAGTAQISVSGIDADLDADEQRELRGTLDVEVVEAEAEVFEITTGTPELQP